MKKLLTALSFAAFLLSACATVNNSGALKIEPAPDPGLNQPNFPEEEREIVVSLLGRPLLCKEMVETNGWQSQSCKAWMLESGYYPSEEEWINANDPELGIKILESSIKKPTRIEKHLFSCPEPDRYVGTLKVYTKNNGKIEILVTHNKTTLLFLSHILKVGDLKDEEYSILTPKDINAFCTISI